MPTLQISKLRRAQARQKQNKARGIMAEEHTLPTIQIQKMRMPTGKRALLTVRVVGSGIGNEDGRGKARGQFLSAMENHRPEILSVPGTVILS